MSVTVHSLGCRLNISESEELRGMLRGAGDLVVVNSCAVTSEAVRQTRRAIRRARRANPDARLLVTGCAAEVERDMLATMPEVDGLVPNGAKLDPRAWNVPAAPPVARAGKRYTRAFVQVQNGCDHACTFCVIPQGRGPSLSRAVPDVLADIARHADAGIREIVLTGVDLTSWGGDLENAPRLGKLVGAILKAFPALERLRLSSIDGAEIDRELFDILGFEPRLMPHLHLSLQSGDDMVLKRMKRRHSRADAVELVARLRAARPGIAIGADIIAGFPTEDETMHANNLSIIRELGIVHGHVFPYSPRPGTPAARMPQVDPATIKARARKLREAVASERAKWLEYNVGQSLRVLAEADGTGHAEDFAPVLCPPGTQPGAIVTITPERIVEGMLA
ncbi:tRNA (N(6)-L-threonylcarbamoyladenosine(37)-C(2))-methylthiotransferase MtaB [Novosphingobium marinum]|uniref:Threonylcarbamoyladenosine tRNA methylthiotransferase MtaB n=1 Tax=Novosphingobium marinum TaxID=1514948 RepID=A0A7Y9XYE7_9SPHN|nr:tRNA (N(6)-L-threonylcarbamoyladenosine(37)-C(2))-methylthiotransferase MtaB [Novosphingobium marinum]NYH96882.1 threonylcarbamoyladenosine tRNA methylthiotransferase MtaB [Novosphingobium marinum]GGC41619.1 tRNA (N(6)-L-threonylcarbamoyladenosine(37)-C(2))-methylthiotransferase MtaB [Novosphingobium marinum]